MVKHETGLSRYWLFLDSFLLNIYHTLHLCIKHSIGESENTDLASKYLISSFLALTSTQAQNWRFQPSACDVLTSLHQTAGLKFRLFLFSIRWYFFAIFQFSWYCYPVNVLGFFYVKLLQFGWNHYMYICIKEVVGRNDLCLNFEVALAFIFFLVCTHSFPAIGTPCIYLKTFSPKTLQAKMNMQFR